MDDLVLLEVADGVATVTLNRPEAMNALSKALRSRLYEVMTEVDADDTVRAVVLTGAGERAFTAGLDLKELGSQAGALGSANATGADENPVKAIELCRKPVIGAINGVAITGGFEVALACDILIASENARFADTHARVGVMPGWLGAEPEAVAADRYQPREGIVAERQLSRCRDRGALGPCQSRGAGGGAAGGGAQARGGHRLGGRGVHRRVQEADRRRLRAAVRGGGGAGA